MTRSVRQINIPVDRREEAQPRPFWDFSGIPNIILLGDPGAGKTHLFREAATAEQARFITARAFLTTPAGMLRGQTLFIDGLDEKRGGRGDRDTVDALVVRLFEVAPTKVRISCRAADWLGVAKVARRASARRCKPHQRGCTLSPRISSGARRWTICAGWLSAAFARQSSLNCVRKRDYHAEVWTAMTGQLERFYAHDPEAKGFGIYVVFWFGAKRPADIPALPNGAERPKTAAEMEAMVQTLLPADMRKRLRAIVIDVSGEV
jgi:hypothetical protein